MTSRPAEGATEATDDARAAHGEPTTGATTAPVEEAAGTEDAAGTEASAGVAVSVVVPTRDRPEALAACLRALAAQTFADLEIVVVDDGSTDAGAVAAVVERAPRARLVRGAGRGPAVARNLGARASAGAVLCFTDDDCRPEPGWVAALAARIGAGADVVAGPTRSGRPGDRCAAAAQTITNHLVEDSYDPARGTVGFAPTSNLAGRAGLHRELPFDEGYPLAAGEDRDWCARLAAWGRAVVYEPAAVVDHHPDLSLRRFWRQQLRYGRGAYRFRHGGGPARRRPPVGFYLDLLRKGFRQGPAPGALVILAQVATLAGTLAEAIHHRTPPPPTAPPTATAGGAGRSAGSGDEQGLAGGP